MSVRQRLEGEIKALMLATLYFGTWLGTLTVLKKLVLDGYSIEFHGFSVAVMGTLVLAKVVLVLERVPLGGRVRSQPAWVEVVLRTVMYAVGVLVALLLEKAFEDRREYGGFGAALVAVFQHAEVAHVWANTICLSGALLGYNALAVVRRHLGEGGLVRLFLTRPAGEPGAVEMRR